MSSRKVRRNIRRSPRIARALSECLEPRVMLTAQPTSWTPLGIGMGGTCYNAIMNPLNPNEFYLETDMGEVWHTLDSGLHWTTLSMQTQLTSNAQTDGVQFTNNTNIQYAISGKSTPKITTDDGLTWLALPGWAAIKAQDGGSATHLIVDPNNSNRIIMMEQKTVGSNYNWWAYYSTDSGATFTLINSDTSGTQTDEPWVGGSFWDDNNTNNIYFATFKGLYKSTNGGSSWTFTSSSSLSKPNNPNGFNVSSGQTYSKIVSFTGSSSGGTTRLWAIAWDGSVNTVSATASGITTYAGLYTSTDGGATWTETEGGIFGKQGVKILTPRFVNAVNDDINSLWVGGEDNSAATSVMFYKSTNAGTSFTRLLQTGYDTTNFPGETPNQNVYTRTWGVGGDFSWGYLGPCITMNVNRANPNYITITQMGTLWGTNDGGANWYDLEGGGPDQLPLTAWNPKGQAIVRGTPYVNSQANETSAWNVTVIDPNTIFVDDTDVTGQFSTDGGAHWSYVQTPGISMPNTFYDSVYVPSTDKLYVVTSDKHDIFTNNIDDGEIEQLGSNFLMVSSDRGRTFTTIHTWAATSPTRTLAIDPNNPDIAYVGAINHASGVGGIWKTTNLSAGASATWTYINQPTRDVDNNGTQDFALKYPDQITILNDGTLIAVAADRLAFAPEYLSPNSLSFTSGVWTSTDGGTTWVDRSSPIGDFSDIYNNGHDMYYTQGNLMTTETFSVTVDPNDPNQNTWFATTYYFGTQGYGTIYKTTDRGAHWSNWVQWANGTSETGTVGQAENLWIQPGGKIMLATTKNGLFYTADYTAATPVWYPVANFPFNGNPSFEIASNPFNSNIVYVTTFGDGVWTADVSQLGVPGIVSSVTATTKSSSEVLLNWNVTAPTGTSYIIEKSTDQINWSTAGTVPSYVESSYLVTGLTANTQYYLRVRSVNAAGNSNPSFVVSARTEAAPAVTAIEETTQAAGPLNGTGSGSGWSTTWAGNNAADTVVAGNINPTNPPDNTGNYISIASTGVDASRTLSSTVGTAGSVVWVGFEYTPAVQGALLFGDSTNGFGIGSQTYSNFISFVTISAGAVNEYRVSSTSGNHFIVGRLEFKTDGTVQVNVYIDPAPGIQYPSGAVGTWTPSWSGSFANTMLPSGTNKITLRKPSSGTAKYDEIRIGSTYADVAPKTGVVAPAAPSGIAGTVISPNQINLTFTNNATNQEGFKIEQWNGTSWTTIERLLNTSASGTVISYSVTNLAVSSTYQFRVSAFNTGGTSATNATGNLTTMANQPPAVTNLAVTVTNGNFNLTWSDVAGETGYTLQYTDATGILNAYNDGELPWQSVNLAAGSTSYTFTTLSTNKIYYFRIYPYNSTDKAYCSNLVTATAYPAPTGVTASPISDTQALVSWTDNIIGESGFTVQYSSNNGSTWTTGATTAAGATYAAISGLSADTVYLFRVQAFATGSTGLWSSNATTRTFSTLSGQIAYDGFNYNGLINGQGSGYGWTGNWSSAGSASQNNSSANLTNPGGTALNNTGNSTWFYQSTSATRTLNYTLGQDSTSLWVGFEINQHITGGTGTLQSSLWLGTDGSNHIELGSPVATYAGQAFIGGTRYYMTASNVTPSDNVAAFLVYRIDFSATGTADSVRLWVNPTPGTQPSDASANSTWTLPAGVNFAFTNNNLRINDATYYDQTTWDELRLGTSYGSVAPITRPAAPSGLTATPGSNNIVLNWTDNANNETGMNVERSTNQTSWTHLGSTPTVGAGVVTYTDSTAVAGTTYYYRVSAANATGDSMPSNTASATIVASATVTLSATTSAAAEDGASGPVNGVFTVTRTGSTSAALTVNYTISGTATNGTDYSSIGTSVTIPIGASSATVTIMPVRDDVPESTETAILTLASGSGYSIGSPSTGTVNIADNGLLIYDGFNYTAGGGTNWNGQGGGAGWTDNWVVTDTTNSGITSGSMPYSSGTHVLKTSGNQAWLHISNSATRTANYTFGQDGTSLWIGFEMNQHINGGAGTLNGGPQLSSDANNMLQLGSPWNGFYDAQAFIGGVRYYGHGETGLTPVAQADNVPVFLVYRLDFGSGTTGDTLRMWVNPVPGTQPSDATANFTWTLSASTHFAFTDNVLKLRDSSYWNTVTYDELRLGTTYYSVAPDPIATTGPAMAMGKSADFNPILSSGRKLGIGRLGTLAPVSIGRSAVGERPTIQAPIAGARRPDASTASTNDSDLLKDDLWAMPWLDGE